MVSVASLKIKLTELQENNSRLTSELNSKELELENQRTIHNKFKLELKEKHKILEHLGQENEAQNKQAQLNLERTAELLKSAGECQRANETLEKRLESQQEALKTLEEQSEEIHKETVAAAQKYVEILEQTREKQELLESYEKKEESLKKTVKDLEDEAILHHNKIRVMTVLDNKATEKINELNKIIKEMSDRVTLANQRAADAELAAEHLAAELSILEEQANDWSEKSENVQQQLDLIRATEQEA